MFAAAAAGTQGSVSWFLGIFGIEAQFRNFMIFVGAAILFIGAAGAVFVFGFSGEEGKRKGKKKLVSACIAAICAFSFIAVADAIAVKLLDAGQNIQSEKVDIIFGNGG